MCARIKTSVLLSDLRGKEGNVVFQKSRSGLISREKVNPSNPRTADQQANRALLASVSSGWGALGDEKRKLWDSAVDSYARTNVFGDSYRPTGKNLFTQLNKNRINAGFALIDTVPDKETYTPVGLTAVSILNADEELEITSSSPSVGQKIIYRATASLSQGTSFYKGKYRQFAVSASNTPLTSTALYTAYVAKFGKPVAGANISFELLFVGESGLLSLAENIKAVVTGV